jgi:hypothetical protein
MLVLSCRAVSVLGIRLDLTSYCVQVILLSNYHLQRDGCGHYLRTRVALAKVLRGCLCCGVYCVQYVEQNNLPCLWSNAPLLPTHKKKRRVKGEVDSIDYHAFVINIPVIHRDCLEKKKLVAIKGYNKADRRRRRSTILQGHGK